MAQKGEFVRDWAALCAEYVERRKAKGKIEDFCKEKGIPYFNFCYHWSRSEFYMPRVGRHGDDQRSSEGMRANDNILLTKQEVEFFRVAKALNSPIRLALLRYLCEGPKTVKDFLDGSEWSYYTVSHALKRLCVENLVDMVGWEGEYNLYALRDAEGVFQILEGIERLAAKKLRQE